MMMNEGGNDGNKDKKEGEEDDDEEDETVSSGVDGEGNDVEFEEDDVEKNGLIGDDLSKCPDVAESAPYTDKQREATTGTYSMTLAVVVDIYIYI